MTHCQNRISTLQSSLASETASFGFLCTQTEQGKHHFDSWQTFRPHNSNNALHQGAGSSNPQVRLRRTFDPAERISALRQHSDDGEPLIQPFYYQDAMDKATRLLATTRKHGESSNPYGCGLNQSNGTSRSRTHGLPSSFVLLD